MSLIRQVWLVLLGALLLAFVGSMGVAIGSARDTFETQLRLKNSDNASALALALSQQKGDQALMNLVMAAQFDTGYYRQIRFTTTEGRVVVSGECHRLVLHRTFRPGAAVADVETIRPRSAATA